MPEAQAQHPLSRSCSHLAGAQRCGGCAWPSPSHQPTLTSVVYTDGKGKSVLLEPREFQAISPCPDQHGLSAGPAPHPRGESVTVQGLPNVDLHLSALPSFSFGLKTSQLINRSKRVPQAETKNHPQNS